MCFAWLCRIGEVAWTPLLGARRSRLQNFVPGVPIVVQYYVDGSAAYLVTGCRLSASETCTSSYHGQSLGKEKMLFRGDLNSWLSSKDRVREVRGLSHRHPWPNRRTQTRKFCNHEAWVSFGGRSRALLETANIWRRRLEVAQSAGFASSGRRRHIFEE